MKSPVSVEITWSATPPPPSSCPSVSVSTALLLGATVSVVSHSVLLYLLSQLIRIVVLVVIVVVVAAVVIIKITLNNVYAAV